VRRVFELVPTPKAVRVLRDGEELGQWGPALQTVELDGRAHTVTFDSPYCYPETIAVPAGNEGGKLARRLKWKPASLTVEAEPKSAEVVVDGTQAVRSGSVLQVPIPLLSPNGRHVVRITVSAHGFATEEREVELRANESKNVPIELRPAGLP
jgi:hypothetical protein